MSDYISLAIQKGNILLPSDYAAVVMSFAALVIAFGVATSLVIWALGTNFPKYSGKLS